MHHAVAAESVGEKEAGEFRRRSEDGVMVRRHFVQSGPGAAGIDLRFFETGQAVYAPGQYLLDEGAVEIQLETRRLLRIVPGEQQSAAFRALTAAPFPLDPHRS